MRFSYTIIRYVPDPLRGEFLNVGALVASADPSTWRIGRRPDLSKSAPGRARDHLRAINEVLSLVEERIQLARRRRAGDDAADGGLTEAYVAALHDEHRNEVQFSRPSFLSAEDADEALALVMVNVVETSADSLSANLVHPQRESHARAPSMIGSLGSGSWLLKAAAVLLALGVPAALGYLYGSSRSPLAGDGGGAVDTSLGVDGLLVAAVQALDRMRPELFSGIEPVLEDERAVDPGGTTMRAGQIPVFAPQGKVERPRPRIRWARTLDEARFEIALQLDAEGETTRTRVELATDDPRSVVSIPWPETWPDLVPGRRYEGDISSSGDTGDVVGDFLVHVATAAEAETYRARVGAIGEAGLGPLSDLVKAHLAARSGFLSDAEFYARRYVEANPEEPVGRQTLDYVLSRLGLRGAR